MASDAFRYQPRCSAARCGSPAVYKIAAPWSGGAGRELKTYALACEDHRDSLLALARLRRHGLALVEGETLGAVGVYALSPGARDAELTRLPDHP